MTRSEARPPGRLRRRLVLGGVLIFLPLGDGAAARLTGRSWTIGFLNIGSEAGSGHLLEAFRKGMRELGYVEGQQYTLDALWANGDISRLGPLAEELVRKPVDLIVTSGPPQVRAVQAATHRIPVVMASGADPIALGVATSLSHPAGNVTGFTNMATETAGKLVELAHELVPDAVRMAVLLSNSPSMNGNWIDAQKAGKQLNVDLLDVRAAHAADIAPAFARIAQEGVQALVVVTDAFFMSQRKPIVELAARGRIPAVYTRREFVFAGGLVSYGVNLAETFRHAATFVDRIFKGAAPGDIPFEQATKFELVVNTRTAKLLGIRIPRTVLLRADEFI